jgi:surfactin synthase thioesterase subunit
VESTHQHALRVATEGRSDNNKKTQSQGKDQPHLIIIDTMTPQPGSIEFVRPPPSPLSTSGSNDDADEASSAHPHLLLYCFPHAGGSPSSFRDWQHHLQQQTGLKVAVRVLSLPGRGGRFQETPWDDWDLQDRDESNDMNDNDGTAPTEAAANAKTNDGYRGKFITALTQAFLLDWDGMTPYAFFGHSFGTLLAYELILQLRRRNIQPLPLLNVVSAHRAPGISPELCGIPQTHTLPRADFVDMIKTWGLVPEEALDDEELVDIMIPALRADLRLDETHIPELLSADKPAAEIVPTVIYGGTQDQTVPSHQLLAWKEVVSPSLPAERTEVVWFEGDHFYTVSHLTEVAADLGRRLKSALENVDRSILVGGMCGSLQSPGEVVESTQSGDRCLVEDGFNDETDRSNNSDDENSCPTVLDLFFDQVRRTPNFLAMVDETGKEWTYTELQAAVILLGQYLIRVNSTESIQHTASEADATASKCQPPRVGIFLHHVSSYLLANLSSWYDGCSVVL